MLKNNDTLLSPELLKVSCEMGHGDEIVLADERARGAYAIVQTSELQPYANFLFKKGVVAQELAP